MTEQPVNVNKISWDDLFPWTIIFKTLPIAVGVSVLVWAMMGVVGAPMGWIIGEKVFLNEQMLQEDAYLADLCEVNRSPYRAVFRATGSDSSSFEILGAKLSGPRLVFENMVKPFKALFRGDWSVREYMYLLFGSLWALAIWSFVGCAITRVCVLRLTRNEPLGIDDAFDFACDNFKDCAGALFMPLGAIALLCIPLGIAGLFMGFNIGVLLMSIFWFVVLAASAVIAFLLFGLLFGWPLIVASVSTEGQNYFDAATRAYAYTFQRPLNYLLYMFVAILFGGFCWLVVSNLTEGVINLSYWTTSWGANRFGVDGLEDSVSRIDVIKGTFDPSIAAGEDGESTIPASLATGRSIIGFWNAFAKTLAAAFIYGLFWCMASAIYLLLRKDVDDTEMDEVFMVDEKRTYELPPLKSDKHGIPQVQEPVPTSDANQDENGDSSS